MKNKILVLLLFFLASCGYQPIYLNKDLEKKEFSKIFLEGDDDINKKILKTLPISENEQKIQQDQLHIVSSYNIEHALKSSSGQITSYKTIISLNLEIKDYNNKSIINRNFTKQSIYNNKENSFELANYQATIKDNLTSAIINEIIIFLSLQ
jgi:hypothetical protein